MADADVPITAGSGTKIDTRTVGAGTDEHRQVVVIGDPVTAANVASADAANGLDVDVTRLPALVAGTANIGDVDVLTLPSIPAGNNNIGDVDIASSVLLAVDGSTAADAAITADPLTTGGRASTAVPTAMSADGDVVNAWFDRRGAQIVRERADMGRAQVVIKWYYTPSATADTLYNGVKMTAGVDAAGASSIGVAAGKILRLETAYFGVRAGAAAAAFGEFSVRTNPSGATIITSPQLIRVPVGATPAVSGGAVGTTVDLGSLEITGAQTLGLSATAQATTNVMSVTLIGYEYDA